MAQDGPETPGSARPPVADGKTVLLFELRTLIDCADLDALNLESWKQALGGFGYTHLTPAEYNSTLALQTPDEIMTALCPFTTRAEWGRFLALREVTLDEGVREFCRANVVPVPGATLASDALVAWSRENMANYKVPRHFEIVEELPSNASGKVLKFELRERAKSILSA